MTHIHYKFSSKLSSATVVFAGPQITLRDLKKEIMEREKLRSGDCDLQITNAQTKEEYTEDEGLIPRGSSVIVRRIPIIGAKSSSKTRNTVRSDSRHHHVSGAIKAMDDQSSSRAAPLFSELANLAVAGVSEEDKIKALTNQSPYNCMNYKKSGAVPVNYICYGCGNPGHHIRNCPTGGVRAEHDKNVEAPLRLKKSTGIPLSKLEVVDDPNREGVMLTNSGLYVIPAIHVEYSISKKEKPQFLPQEPPVSEEMEDPVPNELLCLICRDLLNDAVVIPCCGNSYCDDCIRTALLDSEDHICPTCQQPDVSPDTLIANKFIRQAVNNFEKEQSLGKGLRARLDTSQSQNPTQMPSPVPTPPPQPQRPHLSSHKSSQQDPLLLHSQSADTPQEFLAPPTATGPAPACSTPSTSLQPLQSHLATPDMEAEEKTPNDSPAAPPSVLISHKDSTAAATLVNHTPVSEQPQTVSVNRQQPSSGPTPLHPVPLTYWNSSTSTSGCPTAAWSESKTQQIPPSSCSSSYPAAPPPPLFPSPSFLTAQQPLNSYPPGYPPATHVWTLQTPQSSTIPSLCPPTATSAIPTLIANEWYMHQRKKNDRSPHRGSTYKRSSSRSNSKSSKSKSSRSYSRSSSRSRSRSRSQGRSRPHSPYSRHRDLHTRSHSSQSYSYGYKRSPSLSSSSSPRVGYRSRSKSPSDHRKHSHHSRHHSKKFSSSRHSSKKRGDTSRSEAGVSEKSLASSLCAQQAKPIDSLELSRQQYLQWKREYKEWCDKYFNSYVSHFHQLLPTAPFPQWGYTEEGRHHSHANPETQDHLQGRRTAQVDDHSPPSQSSSDSGSTPSQSSSDSHSTPSRSSSDNRSSPSHSSNGSRSPPSQSSSDGRSTPSKDGVQLREYRRRCAEKHGHMPATQTKVSKGVELQGRRKDDKQLITKKSKNLSTLKHEQKSMKMHEERRGEKSSSPDAADSTDDSRKDMSRGRTGPNSYKDGTSVQDKATACEALESGQSLMKPDKCLDKEYERKGREQDNLKLEKELRRGKYSDSRQDVERQHKEKHSKRSGRVDTDRYRNPGGSKASDSRSEKTQKRKGEDMERRSVEAESSKYLKADMTDGHETHKVEFPDPFDRKQPYTEKKKESKTCPLTERNIWEGGMTVKPQRKISININLHGKQKEAKFEKTDLPCLDSMTEKTKDEPEKTGNGEEEMLSRGATEGNEQKESRRDQEGEAKDKVKPDEREATQPQEKATFKDDKQQIIQKTAREEEHREEEDSELWHCALRGAEDKESAKQWEEQQGVKASDGEELTNDKRRNVMGGGEERSVRNEGGAKRGSETDRGNTPVQAKPKEELMEEVRLEKRKDEDTTGSKLQTSICDSSNTMVDDGSSYEDYQERKLVVKTPDKYSQARAADRKDELVIIQVPRSKWEKEGAKEEEQNEGKLKVQTDALTVPSSSVSVTAERPISRETEREDEQKRHGETDRDKAKAMERGRDREREKNSAVSTSEKSVAPPSGRHRPGSALSAERDRERERRMEVERPGDRERGRESGRQRERWKESKRSKERTREEERRRDRERRDREHGSKTSVQMRNSPSPPSHCHSSHDAERRDRQPGDIQGTTKSSCCPGGKSSSGRNWESSTKSRAAEPPDQNRDILDHFHYYHNPQDPSGNYRHQDRPAGTHSSKPYSQGTERDPHPSESSAVSELGKPRMSRPDQELIQNRSRNESKIEKEERGRKMMDKVIKEGKGERDYHYRVAERKRGGHWENEDDKLDQKTTLVGRREQEEGARPSSSSRKSVSPSSSQESSSDDTRKEWKKKQKKYEKEKRQADPELLLEEEEMKKHQKKSRQCRDGEGDDVKLCSTGLL